MLQKELLECDGLLITLVMYDNQLKKQKALVPSVHCRTCGSCMLLTCTDVRINGQTCNKYFFNFKISKQKESVMTSRSIEQYVPQTLSATPRFIWCVRG